ncbi:MAG TPA: TonB family protein [Steroidobacteraceae bacterium]|jgi:protein TonB|nr:TonB family protein [Steroidobacteraceae bacterium]
MSAYVQDTQFFTRRTIVLFAIIALHIFIAWVLATGLATRAIQLVAPPIQTQIVQQNKQQLKPPPPPPPQLQQQQVQVPPPVVNIQIPQESQTHAITVVKRVVRAAPPAPVSTTPLSAIQNDFPSTDQYYPDASRRLGEQGTALVKLCIGGGGRVVGTPAIERSSGSSRLDEAALRYAKATSGHFRPATRNGQAFTQCVSLPIKFQLTDSF